jgi:FHA domain
LFGLFGKERGLRLAKQAELRGELGKATELYAQAGSLSDCARVMLLRGHAELDPRMRLQLYTQAVSHAPENAPVRTEARKERARLVVGMIGQNPVTALEKREVGDAARELLELGEGTFAAEAFRNLGDLDGEARALEIAGDIEALESLLARRAATESKRRLVDVVAQEAEDLKSRGARKKALMAAEDLLLDNPGNAALIAQVADLKRRRIQASLVSLMIRDQTMRVSFARPLIVGRTEGHLQIPSNTVSRSHLSVDCQDGDFWVTDLQTRNGTTLRGLRISGPLAVGAGLELMLGGAIPIAFAPHPDLPGALQVDAEGQKLVACFQCLKLPGLGWTLSAGDDAWCELRGSPSAPIFERDLNMEMTVQLLQGDHFSEARGEGAVLRILTQEGA